MADNRYGDYGRREGWRDRDSSIFSDDDGDRWSRGSGRWSSDYGGERGGGAPDDRGFFERAGDEVRSWFGDEEAERRRERDMRQGGESRSNYGGQYDRARQQTGTGWGALSGESYDRGPQMASRSSWRDQGDYGRSGQQNQDSYRGGQSYGGLSQGNFGGGGRRSEWDNNYRQWREQQMQQFDQEYEDYCRERQSRFDQDFSNWRSSRLTEGGTSGSFGSTDMSGGSSSGQTLQGSSGGSSGATGSLGSQSAGATTSGGGGSGSAMSSSTGSSGETAGADGGSARGGRGRSRS